MPQQIVPGTPPKVNNHYENKAHPKDRVTSLAPHFHDYPLHAIRRGNEGITHLNEALFIEDSDDSC